MDMEKTNKYSLSLTFSESQTVVDALFDSLTIIHQKNQKFISRGAYDKVREYNVKWEEIHRVLDTILSYQKSLI